MTSVYRATSGNLVATMDVGPQAISSYGALDLAERHGRLARAVGLVEKPAPENAPSTLAVIGRYILQPSVLDALEQIAPGAGGELQLTDAIDLASKTSDLFGLLFDGERFDCGSKAGFLEATVAFGLARPDLGDGFAAALARRMSTTISLAA
jgi:UTP--glucose-1-phosphate uridylyltransferase